MNAEYKIKKKDKIWRVAVACPFCPRMHHHGGGPATEEPVLGTRSAHCGKGEYKMYDRACGDPRWEKLDGYPKAQS
jgi:hypothetical protein